MPKPPNADELFARAKEAPLGSVDVKGSRARDASIELLRAVCARVIVDERGKMGCASCPDYTALALDRAESGTLAPAAREEGVAYVLKERVSGSFTRRGAKQVLLHMAGCSLVLGSDLVLLEHRGERWVLLRYVPLVQTAAINGTQKSRAGDGRDIVAFRRSGQSMPGGLVTLSVCEFGEEDEKCWAVVTTHYIGPCVDPSPLHLGDLKSFVLGDSNGDGRPDIHVDVDAVDIAAFAGAPETFDEACRKRVERRGRRRLTYVRQNDEFVLLKRNSKTDDEEEAVSFSTMDSLR